MQIEVEAAFAAAVDALERVPRALEPFRALSDDALLALTRAAADEVRLAQLHVSLLAGEIARRSAHELGASGLAQRTGHRTADELVTVTTGSRRADARTAVRVGATLVDPRSTLDPVASAVLDGRVSVTVADALRRGLGEPGGDVSAELLAAEGALLVESVGRLDADRAEREARAARDDLELRLANHVDGVAEREEARRAQRSLRIGRRADGMGYASWMLDPESFALVSEVYDRLTAPQRRVPNFDDGEGTFAETAGPGDERTDAQRASDGFVERIACGTGTVSLLVRGAPHRPLAARRWAHRRRRRHPALPASPPARAQQRLGDHSGRAALPPAPTRCAAGQRARE